jgi:hypothetical protein
LAPQKPTTANIKLIFPACNKEIQLIGIILTLRGTLNANTSLFETTVTENKYAGIQSPSVPMGDFRVSHDFGILPYLCFGRTVP